MSGEIAHDPRTRLMRDKYFSLRPKPLERWLWGKGVPASAERVFWLHWQEGLQRGDWCSEIPLKRVARECQLDVSSVTRAYQLLARLGCVRRTDPGRHPEQPFQQATAVTEVRVPGGLLADLERHPNRRAPEPRTAPSGEAASAVHSTPGPEPTRTKSGEEGAQGGDAFEGLRGRARLKALAQLTGRMSASETRAYREALRTRQSGMAFDAQSNLAAEEQGRVVKFLAAFAATAATAPRPLPAHSRPVSAGPRTLSTFELAQLKRDLQALSSSADAPELLRQVVWSIEEGALRRFAARHAIHIALKKIRSGDWSRPHRMPSQWTRAPWMPAVRETCSHA